MELFILGLKLSYALVSAIALIGYVPTVVDLLRGGHSANRGSYSVWSITSIISVMYMVVITEDKLLIMVSSVNLLFCVVIYLLTFKNIQLKIVSFFQKT